MTAISAHPEDRRSPSFLDKPFFQDHDIRSAAREFFLLLAVLLLSFLALIPSVSFLSGVRHAHVSNFIVKDAKLERSGLVEVIVNAFLIEFFKKLGGDAYDHVVKPLALKYSPEGIEISFMLLDTPSVNNSGVYSGSEIEDYKATETEDLRYKVLLFRTLRVFGLSLDAGFSSTIRFQCPIESECSYSVVLIGDPDLSFHGSIISDLRGSVAGRIEGRFVGSLMLMKTIFLFPDGQGIINVPLERFALAGSTELPLGEMLQRLIKIGDLSLADDLEKKS